MERLNKHWDSEEVSILRDGYGVVPIKDLIAKLQRPYQAIRGKARHLGLTPKRPLVGALNGNWKGGYTKMGGGYLKNNVTEKLLHREIAEGIIGRELKPTEIVHHIDGNKANNDSSNLFVCKDISQHRKIHWSLERISMELVKTGKVRFNKETGEYSLEGFGYADTRRA